MTSEQLAKLKVYPAERHGQTGINLLEHLVANQAAAYRSRGIPMSSEILAQKSLEDAKAIIEELKNHYEQ